MNDTLKSGCKIKWKYAVLLLAGALLAVGAAWLLENGERYKYYGSLPEPEGLWQETMPETTEIFWASGDKTVMLEAENVSLWIPTGVDALIEGDGVFAIITGGSGVLTRTLIYTRQGEKLGQVDRKTDAMVWCEFWQDGLLGLCYGKDGVWRLIRCGLNGEIQMETALDADVCYGLVPMEGAVAVETEKELLFFDENLNVTGNCLLGTGEIQLWAQGNDLLAVVLYRQGEYLLKTFSPEGELLGQETLPREARDLTVSGAGVCVLDSESLSIYDAFCRCRSVLSEGGRATGFYAEGDTLWLLGEGEAMKLTS